MLRAVVSEERDAAACVTEEKIQVAVPVDVVELRHRVAAARQPHDCGVHQHEPVWTALAAVVIPRDGILKLSHHEIGEPVAIEIAERGRVVKCGQDVEVAAQPQGRRGARADILEPVQPAGPGVVGLDLRADDQIEIAVPVDVRERRDGLGAEVDPIEQMGRRDRPDARRRLIELVEIRRARLHRIERAA